MTSCGSRRDGGAVCCKISCCSFIQTATHKHRPTERIFDAFRCIKPVELRMYQLLQTAVELLGTSNHTSCRVQHSLKLVSDSLWNPGENDVAVVDSRHHSHVLQRSDYHLSNARHSISLWQCALSEWLLKRLSDRLFIDFCSTSLCHAWPSCHFLTNLILSRWWKKNYASVLQ